jgi:hypothetical protein
MCQAMQKTRIGVGPILRNRFAQVNRFFLRRGRGARGGKDGGDRNCREWPTYIRSVYFLFDMLNTALRPDPNRGTFLAIRLSILAGWVSAGDQKGLC